MPSILLPGGVLAGRKTLRHHRTPSDKEAYEICSGMATVLTTVYPGYLWQVGMQGDLVYVQNLNLNKKQGFRAPLSAFDVEGKLLMRAGGELLERFGCRRSHGRDENQLKSLKRDIRGDAVQV